jgi:DNA-binding CsgD family transcriptional regulator
VQIRVLITLLTVTWYCNAQYSFSGYTIPNEWQNTVYLSVIEDYRKMSGVYSEQIISKTTVNNDGFFEFNGDMLNSENRIYRIHVDNCPFGEADFNHFNGHCVDSEELLFIANNSDTLKLPFSFGNQVFCTIESTNDKASAFLKIDSLKSDMRFAYTEVRTEANRKLNNRKWFKTLQDFGENLNEPLAELAIYAFLSDRSSNLYNYYVEDLKVNPYYDNLKMRLESAYPNAPYTVQYRNEITADRFMLSYGSSNVDESKYSLNHYTLGLLIMSLLLNLYFLYFNWIKQKEKSKDLKSRLSKQEQIVLEHLLLDKSNRDIAEALFLSVSTIKTHTNNIYKKLNVQSREEAKSLFINLLKNST